MTLLLAQAPQHAPEGSARDEATASRSGGQATGHRPPDRCGEYIERETCVRTAAIPAQGGRLASTCSPLPASVTTGPPHDNAMSHGSEESADIVAVVCVGSSNSHRNASRGVDMVLDGDEVAQRFLEGRKRGL